MEWLLKTELAGSTLMQWATASATALFVILVARVAKSLLHKRVVRLAERTRTRWDDIVVSVLENTKWFSYIALGVYLGSLVLNLGEPYRTYVRIGASLMLLVQIGIWLQTALKLVLGNWRSKHVEKPGQTTMAAGIGFVLSMLLWTLICLMALSNMGIEITALIAGLGMGGIAAALAIQSVLGDIFASLSIYFDRPFDIGDVIVVDGMTGTVERIGMRSTRVRALEGEELVYSNRNLVESRIRNFKRMRERRVEARVGVEYGLPFSKIEQIPKILREAIEEQKDLRFDRAHLKELGDSSLLFEYCYWVPNGDYKCFMDRQQAIHFAILKRFEQASIDLAFHTQTVRIDQDTPFRIEGADLPQAKVRDVASARRR
jgi:small-conductance mechanosensitive channel